MRIQNVITVKTQFSGDVFPLIESRIPAGFPSPAEEYMGDVLSVEEFLIKDKTATFFVRVAEDGDSMIDRGILPNDVLVVNRGVEPKHRSIVVAILFGEFTVKEIDLSNRGRVLLQPRNKKMNYPTIEITEEMDFSVWGVVTGRFGNF